MFDYLHVSVSSIKCFTVSVGRVASIKTQPTPHKVSSFKRPRLNPKAGVPKRKVLIDDTMVLHAEYVFHFSYCLLLISFLMILDNNCLVYLCHD